MYFVVPTPPVIHRSLCTEKCAERTQFGFGASLVAATTFVKNTGFVRSANEANPRRLRVAARQGAQEVAWAGLPGTGEVVDRFRAASERRTARARAGEGVLGSGPARPVRPPMLRMI